MVYKIVFLDRETFPKSAIIPRPSVDHHWIEYGLTESDQILDRIRDADIVLTNKTAIRADVLQKCENLKLIVLTATGYDHIDLPVAKKRGIVVCNCLHYGTPSIAEHTLMLMMNLSRNAYRYMRSVEKGGWQKTKNFCIFDYPVFELKGKVLCIFGRGATGCEVARLAKAFGLKVYFADRKRSGKQSGSQSKKQSKKLREGYIAFDDALKMADIISLHLPLNEETHFLFSHREFEMMKPSVFLVNVARGQIVDQEALVAALKEKKIAGAALDVIDKEPPTIEIEKHSLLKEIADDRFNLIVSPHVAWLGSQSIATLLGQCMENIEQFHKGTPVRMV